MRLFILGNGFDLAHGLPTSYEDFRKYLYKKYVLDLENMPYIPTKNENMQYDIDQIATLLVYLISMAEEQFINWADVERSLGEIDYSCFFPGIYEDIEDLEAKNEVISDDLYNVVIYIKKFFADWINSIDLKGIKKIPNFERIIRKDDLFLTFNYTETLETLYGIKNENICHIHGKQRENIIFGHGNSKIRFSEDIAYAGADMTMWFLDSFLMKDVVSNKDLNMEFFERLEDISEVYVIGFSFGDVDDEYIEEVYYQVDKHAIWHFNQYDAEKVPLYLRKLRSFGAFGYFDVLNLT